VDRLHRKDHIKDRSSKYIARVTKYLVNKRKLANELNKQAVTVPSVKESKSKLEKIVLSKIDMKKKIKHQIQY
jgi:hypothetical protein